VDSLDVWFHADEIEGIAGLVTLALLYMTVLSVFAKQKLPEGMDGIGLLFTGLFALPSVRGVMPGGPPFGMHVLSSTHCPVLTMFTRLYYWYDDQLSCFREPYISPHRFCWYLAKSCHHRW
jgi:hypothetical protein